MHPSGSADSEPYGLAVRRAVSASPIPSLRDPAYASMPASTTFFSPLSDGTSRVLPTREPTSSDASTDPSHSSKSASTTVFSPSSDGTSSVLPTRTTPSSDASTSAYFHHPLMEYHQYYQRVSTSVLLYLHIFHHPLMYTPSSLDVLAQ